MTAQFCVEVDPVGTTSASIALPGLPFWRTCVLHSHDVKLPQRQRSFAEFRESAEILARIGRNAKGNRDLQIYISRMDVDECVRRP